jgi:hypothetical protein
MGLAMDIRITGVGVVFVAIAILAFMLISGGNGVSAIGNSLDIPSLSNSGGSMSALGTGLVVVLVLMAAAVVYLRR